MPQKITETNVLQITTVDTESNRRSFNLENPRNNITIDQVRDIFSPIINSGKWYSDAGNPITYIEQATLTKTKKTELSDGTAITITPASITRTTSGEDTLTVTGSPIKGYKITITSGASSQNAITNAKINATANTITINSYIAGGGSGGKKDFELTVVTAEANLTVPISLG